MTKKFVSSKGIEVKLIPVSQFKIDALRNSKPEITHPTYEAETVGGGKQVFALDAESAKNKGRLAEWEAYIAEKAKIESTFAKRFVDFMIWEGVDVEVPGPDSAWQKQAAFFGMVIPEDEIERKLYYVYNELLAVDTDIAELVSDVLAVSQIDEEVVKNLRKSFRLAIQRQKNRKLPETQEPMENE